MLVIAQGGKEPFFTRAPVEYVGYGLQSFVSRWDRVNFPVKHEGLRESHGRGFRLAATTLSILAFPWSRLAFMGCL